MYLVPLAYLEPNVLIYLVLISGYGQNIFDIDADLFNVGVVLLVKVCNLMCELP